MNKKMIWISALALSASISQGVIACDSECPGNVKHHHHMMGKHFDKMMGELDLTAEQEKKIHAIRDQEKASMKPKIMEMHDINIQLNDLAKGNVIDEAKMNDLIAKKEKIVGEMTKNRVMTRYQINMILDAKQKEKMDKMTLEMREKMKEKMEEKMEEKMDD